MVLDGKSSQEYPVNARVPQGSIRGPTLFLLYINDLPDDVICNIAIYANDTTLWGRKWLVDFNAGKAPLVSFDWSRNPGAIDVKTDGSVLVDGLFRVQWHATEIQLLCS